MLRFCVKGAGCSLWLVLLLFWLLGSTGQEPRADFVYVNPSDLHTLDPARMSWLQDFRVALNIWEGLTTWDGRTLRPIGGVANFPPTCSEDGRTYTFRIRQDARWSNGDPVVASDFVRGWRRAMEPGTAADYAYLFTENIEGAADYVHWRYQTVAELTPIRPGGGGPVQPKDGVHSPRDDRSARVLLANHAAELDDRFRRVGLRVLDDQTLSVRLKSPCPYFLDLTGLPAFLPCHESIERLRERFEELPLTESGLVVYDPQWTKPNYARNGYPGLITNGPYRLADWRFKRRARLAVNSFYPAAPSLACRTVDMLVYDNLNAALSAYEMGQVDFLPELSVAYDHEIARLSRSGERPDFHLCPVLATYFLNFNCASAAVAGRPNPVVDRRVRRALTLAVDRDRIVHNVRARGDRPAWTFIPPDSIPGYAPPAGLRFDPAEGRRLLSEAGFADGTGLPPILLLYTQNDERVMQALARMWEMELGVRVDLVCKETKTFGEDKADQRFMAARGKWYADYLDPTTFLDCFMTGNGNNDSAYSSAAYDALLADANRAKDPQTRAALLAQAEALLVAEDVPLLPIFHFTEPVALHTYVRGLYPNARLWFPFRDVRIER